MPRQLCGDRPPASPGSGTVASAGAQIPHTTTSPRASLACSRHPQQGLVCCSHRLLEPRVWVSTGRTHSGGRHLAFLSPKTTSSSQAAPPGAVRGRTHAISSILAGPAQTLPQQLRPDPAVRDPRPPQICWVREKKPGSRELAAGKARAPTRRPFPSH